MTNKSILSAFIGGLAAGATLGVLLAPDSGAATRKKIAKKAHQTKESFDEMVEEGKNSWFEAKGKLSSSAGIAAHEVNDFVSHLMEKGKDWLSNARSTAESMADEASDAVEHTVRDGKRKAQDLKEEGKEKLDAMRAKTA